MFIFAWECVSLDLNGCCQDDSLVTRNLVPGESVYGEKRLVAESADGEDKCLGNCGDLT